ncbi:YkvA family protein [Acetivibrio clariflavus]|uniref:DUF1232 domain-containing protein n=1 Tax=Acetivibrio clariflavus (strain DSM 19732 / NBRC 101661 / EBR45) TaxID=720554 RepID=G8M126_ACECE|nr:YkvA family protein [Acetivibrio clariflavus]AEV66967.1 hypothetical protein Clocl_0225 [Acetivibrio clariflavus DSM 19732]
MIKRMKEKTSELKKQVFALYLAYKKKETPLIAKVFTAIVVAYALSPIDLIPDFIPVLGYLDDFILIPMGVAIALKLIPAEIMEECRKEADRKLKNDIPEAKVAGVIIVMLWILILGFIGYRILTIIKAV